MLLPTKAFCTGRMGDDASTQYFRLVSGGDPVSASENHEQACFWIIFTGLDNCFTVFTSATLSPSLILSPSLVHPYTAKFSVNVRSANVGCVHTCSLATRCVLMLLLRGSVNEHTSDWMCAHLMFIFRRQVHSSRD